MAAKVKWDRDAWWVHTHYNRKRYKLRVGATKDHKTQADKMAEKINAAIALGQFKPEEQREKAMPCDKELNKWHTAYSPTLKLSYEQLTRGLINRHLIPHFGSKDLREIRETDLLQFVQKKLDQGLTPKTIRNSLSVLRRVYNLAQRANRITHNPASHIGELLRRVDKREATEVKTIDSWSRKEVGTLLALARKHEARFYPALAFLFYTGVRRGEVLALKWEDVDFDRQRIHIRRAYVKGQLTSPKSGKGRYVMMAPRLGELLLDVLAERRREAMENGWPELPEWVFCSKVGGIMDHDNFERPWRRVRRKAQAKGVRALKMHCARHTWASLALASGKSVRWVAEQLGHADPSLTLRVYAHVIPDEETDLSFLSFGSASMGQNFGPGRPYTAPESSDDEESEDTDDVTTEISAAFLARPARLERATFRSAT